MFVVLQLCLALLPGWGLTRQEGLCATEMVTSTDVSASRGGERAGAIFVSVRDRQIVTDLPKVSQVGES